MFLKQIRAFIGDYYQWKTKLDDDNYKLPPDLGSIKHLKDIIQS